MKLKPHLRARKRMRSITKILALLFGSTSLIAADVDYEHGRAQVKQMLIDRPLFRFYRNSKYEIKELKQTDAPYIWAVKQFGGLATGEPIVWMPQEPETARAEYVGQSMFAPGFIRISFTYKRDDGVAEPLSFDEGWKCIAFELNNIANSNRMAKLRSAARNGRISRDEFIWDGPKYEYEARNKTVAFYKAVWKPWAKKVGALTYAPTWENKGRPLSYEEWLKRFAEADPNGYPWKYYGEVYDDLFSRKQPSER